MPQPSEEAQEWGEQQGPQEAAAGVPADVADQMRAFVQALTTPESELEQQVLEEVQRWAARHEVAEAAGPLRDGGGQPDAACAAAAGPSDRCLASSSMHNSGSSSPSWSGSGEAAVAAGAPGSGGARAPSSSSGRSSEEGSSAAWRLASFLQRSGWPVQHCASVRSGGGGGGGGGGWRFNSGHEFLLLYPRQPGTGSPPADSGGSSDGGDGDVAMPAPASSAPALVIDPEFATQFALASPSPRYQMVLALLPRVFVGTYDRLQQLVEWACAEMRASFSGSGGGLPPWRSLAHMLNKWRLGGGQDKAEEEEGEEGSDSARRAVGSWPGVHVPSAAAAAFSAEQQQAMRMLLLQPVGAAVPAPHRGMTASSSCSSMDVVSAPPAPTPSPAGGLATPRSLLTQELSGLAASGGLKPQQAQGPAAAILSMALGSGRQAMQLDGSCA